MTTTYEWRGEFENREVESLHAEGFGHTPVDYDWWAQLTRHSLGWVCARTDDRLVGFVNVAWDGGGHAFLIDTVVAKDVQHQGLGVGLVAEAGERARAARCEWLHVDFQADLREFYFEACGFTPTSAGLIQLRG